jgi:pyrroline-5-carboxylate reductase
MKKIVFYGGGNIAQANIKGLISSGIKKQDILYIERNIKNKEILNKIGVKEFSLEKKFDVEFFILAVKPKDALNAYAEICINYNKPKIISLVAGIKSKKYLSIANNAELIRGMPNTAAEFNKANTALINISSSNTSFKKAKNIFSKVGIILELDKESKMDDFTGLIGSGPAYFFYLLKVYEKRILKMCDGDIKKTNEIIGNLLEGVSLSSRNNLSMDELIGTVASKKGTTEAGIKEFKSLKVLNSFEKGIIAAIKRSKEISNES